MLAVMHANLLVTHPVQMNPTVYVFIYFCGGFLKHPFRDQNLLCFQGNSKQSRGDYAWRSETWGNRAAHCQIKSKQSNRQSYDHHAEIPTAICPQGTTEKETRFN